MLRAGTGAPIFDPITAFQSLSIVGGIVFAGVLMFFPTAYRLLVQARHEPHITSDLSDIRIRILVC